MGVWDSGPKEFCLGSEVEVVTRIQWPGVDGVAGDGYAGQVFFVVFVSAAIPSQLPGLRICDIRGIDDGVFFGGCEETKHHFSQPECPATAQRAGVAAPGV